MDGKGIKKEKKRTRFFFPRAFIGISPCRAKYICRIVQICLKIKKNFRDVIYPGRIFLKRRKMSKTKAPFSNLRGKGKELLQYLFEYCCRVDFYSSLDRKKEKKMFPLFRRITVSGKSRSFLFV